MTDRDWVIRVRGQALKKAYLLTPKGGITHLKVHASRWTDGEKAKAVAADLNQQYPDGKYVATAEYV